MRLLYRAFGYNSDLFQRPLTGERMPVAYFYFNGWSSVQLGVHVSLSQPNIEIHVPFGFFRIGWVMR